MKKIFFVFLIYLSSFCFTSAAWSMNEKILVVPNCLLTSDIPHTTLATADNLFLISINSAGWDKLLDAREVKQTKPCGGFINVTHAWKNNIAKSNPTAFLKNYTSAKKSKSIGKYKIQYQKQVGQLLPLLQPNTMWTNLTSLSDFTNRHANSNEGVIAALWIKKNVEDMVKLYGRNDVSVYTINTSGYKQPSVIVKIGKDLKTPGVIFSAHMDTLMSSSSKKPGADDDGSGTVTALEATRVILQNGMKFNKPIYVIWYAAEEMGLVGSQNVVAVFKEQKIPVDAVLHLDMTGYMHNQEKNIWLMDDFTNPELTKFLGELLTTYVNVPVGHTKCGYACSDHATWTLNGYAATLPAEASMENINPYIHTSSDTLDKLSLEHMTNFAKLALSFATELAGPTA